MTDKLLNPIESFGIQQEIVEKLNKINLNVVFDLLLHLPYRFENKTRLLSINKAEVNKYGYFAGIIINTNFVVKKRKQFVVTVKDEYGKIDLVFYNITKFHTSKLKVDSCISFYGEIKFSKGSKFIVHPDFELISKEDLKNKNNLIKDKLTPVYNTTAGLNQRKIRSIVKYSLNYLAKIKSCNIEITSLKNIIPNIVDRFSTISEAISYIHEPLPLNVHQLYLPALQRVAIEELIAHHVSLKRIKQFNLKYEAPKFSLKGELLDKFIDSIPFELTSAQKKAVDDINFDLNKITPMIRLVQGDVGSGKTIVSAIASVIAIQSGYQVALMAPTELLAEQHYSNFINWFDKFNIKTCLLSGKLTNKNKDILQREISEGKFNMIIGTHALFQENTNFLNLGLIMIDEQHRFGVKQRKMLRDKGVIGNRHPHQLILTATPIPRTLALTFHADLDCSIIDELPPGRQIVHTKTVPEVKRDDIVKDIYKACNQGAQAYWVCPLITESEVLECQAAEKIYEKLKSSMPNLNIGLIHGKMKADEKEAVMQLFVEDKIKVLVATTVIEVGVNVPNATLIIMENSERLGLAQLHQLRGRVGRGVKQSYCYLLHSDNASQMAKAKLKFISVCHDGFKLAEKDLEFRGPGEFLGNKQTGGINFKIADLARDKNLLPLIPNVASTLSLDTQNKLISFWVQSAKNFAKI